VQVLLDALRGLYPCFRKTRSATFIVDLMVGGYLHRESLFHLYDHCSTAGHSKSLCPAESLQLEIVIAGEKVQTAVCRSQGFESRSIFPLQQVFDLIEPDHIAPESQFSPDLPVANPDDLVVLIFVAHMHRNIPREFE